MLTEEPVHTETYSTVAVPEHEHVGGGVLRPSGLELQNERRRYEPDVVAVPGAARSALDGEYLTFVEAEDLLETGDRNRECLAGDLHEEGSYHGQRERELQLEYRAPARLG